jgi:hypothetical protein
MSLLVYLPSSSFFLPDYLLDRIEKNQIKGEQFKPLFRLNINIVSLAILEKQSLYSNDWFYYAQYLAKKNGHVALLLGHYYDDKQQTQQANLWYRQVLKLNLNKLSLNNEDHQIAIMKLVEFYDEKQNYLAIKKLFKHQLTNTHLLVNAIELAIKYGDLDFIEKHLLSLKETDIGQQLLTKLVHFNVVNHSAINKLESDVLCENSIQMFATNLSDLKHGKKLIHAFQQHPLNQAVCFLPMRYIPYPQLACHHQTNERIQCDESRWRLMMDNISSRYIGVLLPAGGANVHHGIMYIDAADNVNVFAHEVSHLLGFIDEYPLSDNHNACSQNNVIVGSNIAIIKKGWQGARKTIRAKVLSLLPWANLIKETTPLVTKIADNWVVGTPDNYIDEVGVFPARTCEKQAVEAFKPLHKSTQLEYFEYPFSSEYIELQQHVQHKYRMPSYIFNVQLAESQLY